MTAASRITDDAVAALKQASSDLVAWHAEATPLGKKLHVRNLELAEVHRDLHARNLEVEELRVLLQGRRGGPGAVLSWLRRRWNALLRRLVAARRAR